MGRLTNVKVHTKHAKHWTVVPPSLRRLGWELAPLAAAGFDLMAASVSVRSSMSLSLLISCSQHVGSCHLHG